MDPKSMTRKDFLALTFTLVGGGAVIAAGCGSSSSTTPPGGCSDPLPEGQEPDDTQHTHTVTVAASALNATTDQIFTTSNLGHTHMITLAVADLATIKGGGMVVVTSTSNGTPAHTHRYAVGCHSVTLEDAGAAG